MLFLGNFFQYNKVSFCTFSFGLSQEQQNIINKKDKSA